MSALANCTIRFHTNDEDKDGNTHVTVDVLDFDNVVAAHIDEDFGHFDDHSDSGPFPLAVQNASSRDKLQRGVVTVRIDPKGNDTWRFNYFLELIFDDGSRLSGGVNGLELTQDHNQQIFGLQGVLHP